MDENNQDQSQQIPVSTPADAVPAAPAAPAEPATPDSVKDITVDGYTFKVDTDVIDDVDNVDLIDKIENYHNLKAIVDFLIKLLGQDGYDKLKAHYVASEGKLALTKLADIYQAIFAEFDPKG